MQWFPIVTAPLYEGFLGLWRLLPETCEFEQGDPPLEGICHIAAEAGALRFALQWRDATGDEHRSEHAAAPDGVPAPFAGGDLADSMSVTAESARELTSRAFYRGRERMVAQRQLSESGAAMRLVQLVRFPDGGTLVNTSIYRKVEPN